MQRWAEIVIRLTEHGLLRVVEHTMRIVGIVIREAVSNRARQIRWIVHIQTSALESLVNSIYRLIVGNVGIHV